MEKENQTLSCLGCGDIGHVAALCDKPDGSIYHLVSVCENCTRTHSFSEADRTVLTTTTPCSIHLPRLLGDRQTDQADTDRAQLLVDKVLDFRHATDSTTDEALQWLGVSQEEYKAAQDLVYFQ